MDSASSQLWPSSDPLSKRLHYTTSAGCSAIYRAPCGELLVLQCLKKQPLTLAGHRPRVVPKWTG